MKHSRIRIDIVAETARMRESESLRVVFENRWERSSGDGSVLRLPWGLMVQREIRARFNSGPPAMVYEDGSNEGRITRRHPRWDQMIAVAPLGVNPVLEVVDELSILYREPIQITGDVGASEVWGWLRTRCGLDRVLQRRQRMEIGIGSAVVMPSLRRWGDGIYYPPGLEVVPPDQCIAVSDPTSPDNLVFLARNMGNFWLVWDVSDPRNPIWGRWESVEGHQRGQAPTWSMEGDDYPFWWGGRPLCGGVASQADPAELDPLPYWEGQRQAVLDILMSGTWVEHVRQASSYTRAIFTSRGKLQGLDQLMEDPSIAGSLWGEEVQMETLPHGLDGVRILAEMQRARVHEWVSGINAGFEVRQSDAAKSGVALLIEMTGKVQAAQEMETRNRPIDRATIQLVVAAFNWMVRAGVVGMEHGVDGVQWDPYSVAGLEWLIPEGGIEIKYPRKWNEPERQRIRAEMLSAVDAGLEDVRAVWLLDNGMEDDRPDGQNWADATVGIQSNLQGRAMFAASGYGVPWEKLWLGPTGASGNQTTIQATEGSPVGLNGAQMDGALNIVDRVLNGKAPREVGVNQLMVFLGVPLAQAESIMGTIGAGFTPAQPEGYDVALRDSAGSDVQSVQTALSMQQLGYDAGAIAAFLRTRGVLGSADEAATTPQIETFNAPDPVSRTASRGLRLRDEFGRGLDAMTPQGRRLKSRAKKLQARDDMTRAEVLELDGWLEAHSADGDKPAVEGIWGDDSDPSAAWVEWLSQGGEDGLAWTNGVLTEEEAPSVDENPLTSADV